MDQPLRWNIGDVEVIRIAEACDPFPVSMILPGASLEAMTPHLPWLQPHFVDAEGRLLLSVHGLVIKSRGTTIMVDTCVGPHALEEHGQRPTNAFFENLESAGLSPEDIDVVLCTHMHFDHVGWNTMRVGDAWVPTFKNARYLFSRDEWEHWHSAKDKGYATTLNECVQPVIDAGLCDLVAMDHAITDEVRLVPTPGHTPGHVGVSISSRGANAYITGDTVFHPIQWAEIEWGSDADYDAGKALAMRRQVRETYGSPEHLIIGTHFAPPTAGHVIREGDGWWFRAQLPE